MPRLRIKEDLGIIISQCTVSDAQETIKACGPLVVYTGLIS